MLEVQDVFNTHSFDYFKQHNLPPHVCKAIRAIQNCRTSALGGHMEACDECGKVKISYNSCRNRNCPKCQALSKERWISAREADLLPVGYFHVVFTLPEELNTLVMHNRKCMFNLLFRASAETLQELAKDKKYLGAELGFTSILHTWGQNLMFHPHVHIIVPGGGLTKAGLFQLSRQKFFIPVKVLAKMFRGKFLHYLKQQILQWQDDNTWQGLLNTLYTKDWYVYCKRPFKTTQSVLQYLGRYTHRIAISNHRLLSLQDGKVSFKWRDYKDASKEKVMALAAEEFIRRFLLHILPQGFTKIRHYGFLAPGNKKTKLSLCKRLTGSKIKLPEKLSAVELMQKLTGRDISLCTCCGIGHFVPISGLSPPKAV